MILTFSLLFSKDKSQRKFAYSVSNFIFYDYLSPSSNSLIAALNSISIPKTVKEALSHLGWHDAMLEEIKALDDNHT